LNIIYFLLPIALALGFFFTASFIFASRKGQFDDLETPAHRILLDDETSHERWARIEKIERQIGLGE
jgi:cbb3-type cytochrome oxidase maturation protein